MVKPISIVATESMDKASAATVFDPLEALKNLPFACFVTDSRGTIFFANQIASSIIPRSTYHLRDRDLFDIFGFSEEKKNRIHKITNEGGTVRDEGVIGDENGEKWAGGITIMPFDSANKYILITMLPKIFHEGLHTTYLSGSKRAANMAEILAHEVKNPLAGIRGSAQLLEQNAPPEDKHLIDIICDECDRIRKLLDDMEAFSNPRSAEFSPLNIHDILLHVIRLSQLSFQEEITIEQGFDPSLPEIFGDRDQLIQVFLNIVKNAAEAIIAVAPPEGGRITIRTRYRHGERIKRADRDAVLEVPICVEISDNGGGIDGGDFASIFEPFVTSKIGGKGLGLALVHKIIGDHSGKITARNLGAGACFELYFPVYRDETIGGKASGGDLGP